MSLKTRILLVAAGGIVCLLLLFFLLFSLKNVIVTGNTRYTDQEICDMALDSPWRFNTLLFCFAENYIDMEGTPFLDHITTEFVNRNTVRLDVTEKSLVGIFRVDDKDYYFDESGVVTDVIEAGGEEESEMIKEERVPLITGVAADNIGLGCTIEFENESVLGTIRALAGMIEQYGILPDRVYFDKDYNITLYYGSTRILLGQDDLLEEKMNRAAAILPNIQGMSGELHLENYSSDTENIVFDKD